MLGATVGKALEGCSWVGVPFAGGMAEIPHITARTLVVNDLHLHMMNMCSIAADPVYGPKLWRRLRRVPFHAWVLEKAQAACATYDPPYPMGGNMEARLNFAENYFICAWMARNGTAGTKNEFKAGLSCRWEAGGGDSAVRWRNAVAGLREWRAILGRCTFSCMDAFEFLAKCKDEPGHGIYSDAPWPDDGDGYRHRFDEGKQRQLAAVLGKYRQCRVVVRFGDHPLIRKLCPESHWQWSCQGGRTAANKEKAEVLLVKRPGTGPMVAVPVDAAELFAETNP